MSTEAGVITKVTGEKAMVLVKRTSMCAGCGSRGSCNISDSKKEIEAEALNTAGGKEGDTVLLEIKSASLLKMSFLVYLFPVVALIGGAIAGMKTGDRYSQDIELFAMLVGIAAFAVSLILIKLVSGWMKNKNEYMPEIVKIFPQKTGE